jgi:hypothetical protein
METRGVIRRFFEMRLCSSESPKLDVGDLRKLVAFRDVAR